MSPDVRLHRSQRDKTRDARRCKFKEEKFSFISILRRQAAHTNPSTSGRQEDRKKREGGKQERKRDTSRSSLQTYPKRAGLSGFPCSASRTHDAAAPGGTHLRHYVFHAHPVEATKKSPRDSSSRRRIRHVKGTYCTAVVECFRAESSCKCSFGHSNLPVETRSFPQVSLQPRDSRCCLKRQVSLRGNYDEVHYGVINLQREYTRAVT